MIRFFLFLIFCSCSSLKTDQPITSDDVNQQLSGQVEKICFSGEGKGRFTSPNNHYMFSYESLLKIDQSTWSIALNIPMHGEELINLHWNGEEPVSGNFYDKNKRKYPNRELPIFFKRISDILQFATDFLSKKYEKYQCPILKNPGKTDISGKCQKGDNFSLNWQFNSDQLQISTTLASDHTISLRAFSPLHGKYRRMVFTSKQTDHFTKKEKQITLEMFVKECQ